MVIAYSGMLKKEKGKKKDLGPFTFFFLSVLVNLAVRGLK